jgi:hypothetical protein
VTLEAAPIEEGGTVESEEDMSSRRQPFSRSFGWHDGPYPPFSSPVTLGQASQPWLPS